MIGAIVQAEGAQDASVLVFEDLHWLDAASDEMLAQIVESQATTSGFIVLNFRPEYQPRWMNQSFYQQIALSPLEAQPIAELVQDRVGDDPSVASLAALVLNQVRSL